MLIFLILPGLQQDPRVSVDVLLSVVVPLLYPLTLSQVLAATVNDSPYVSGLTFAALSEWTVEHY